MRQWRRGLWLCLALGVLGFVVLGTALLAESQLASGSSTPTVRIADATVEPGGSETVALEVLGVTDPLLGAVTVDIIYDPDAKTPTECVESLAWALCNIDYAVDTIRVTRISAEGVTGNVTLANITFQAVGDPGCTALQLSVVTLTDTDGNPITHTTDDGENCIVSPSPGPSSPTPSPTPSPGPSGPTPTPTATVTVTATPTPTPTPGPDDDGDGLPNDLDPCPNDDDCDDDGLMDGSASSEDLNDNGVVDPGETDPANWDSDGDGLSDGLERGLTTPEGQDTDTTSPHWQPDAHPTTRQTP